MMVKNVYETFFFLYFVFILKVATEKQPKSNVNKNKKQQTMKYCEKEKAAKTSECSLYLSMRREKYKRYPGDTFGNINACHQPDFRDFNVPLANEIFNVNRAHVYDDIFSQMNCEKLKGCERFKIAE